MNSALNLGVTSNSDGYVISGGTTTTRALTISGGDVTLVGGSVTLTLSGGNMTLSGGSANTFLFPGVSDTLAGLTTSQTFTNTSFSSSPLSLTGAFYITPTGAFWAGSVLQIQAPGSNVTLGASSGGTLTALAVYAPTRGKGQALIGDSFTNIPASAGVNGLAIYDGVVGRLSVTSTVSSLLKAVNQFKNDDGPPDNTLTGGAALVGFGNTSTGLNGSASSSFINHGLLLINSGIAVGGGAHPCGTFTVGAGMWNAAGTPYEVMNGYCTQQSLIFFTPYDVNAAGAQAYISQRFSGYFIISNTVSQGNAAKFAYIIINPINITSR